jgi:MFS family permease
MSTPVAASRGDGNTSPVAFATETAISKIKAQQQEQQLKQQIHRSVNAPSSVLPFRLSSVITNDDNTDNDDDDIEQDYMEMNPQAAPNVTRRVGFASGEKERVEDHLNDMNFKSLSEDNFGTTDNSGVWTKPKDRNCLTSFFSDAVWPGLGLLGESYMLFSIGILRPIWDIIFPDCFVYQTTCTEFTIHSLTYSIIIGVIVGMICIGYASNNLGRRRGSITTASLMCIGSWSLSILSYLAAQPEFADSINSLFWCISISFFVFGVGVGGEYPLSAASASEKAIEDLQTRIALEKGEKKKAVIKSRISKLLRDDTNHTCTSVSTNNNGAESTNASPMPNAVLKSHRGRRVQLVFSMQGVGILLNCLVLTGLLALFGKQNDDNEYNTAALLFIWQVSYYIGSLILSFVLISRVLLLNESKVWMNVKRERRIAEELKRIKIQEQALQSSQEKNNQAVEDMYPSPSNTKKAKKVIPIKNSLTPYYTPPDPPGRTNISSYPRKQKGDDDGTDSMKDKPLLPNKYHKQQSGGTLSDEEDDYSFSDTVSSMTLPTLVQNDFQAVDLVESPLPDRVSVKGTDKTSADKQKNIEKDAQFLGPDGVPEDADQARRIPSSPQQSKYQPVSNYFARKLSQRQRLLNEKQQEECDLSTSRTKATGFILLLQQYGMRLAGVSAVWMLWDVAFYGNKLFQSTFLLALTGEETKLLDLSIAATINAAVALLGYIAAASIIDSPYVGRTTLQQWGFLVVAILFVVVGYYFDQIQSKILITLYLCTSFVGQLGPNATTFLIPVEVFPTEMRTYCHGIAAASGKVGALIASVAFNYISNDADLFLFSGYASFIGCFLTFVLIPNTTGLDLYEYDKKWKSFIWGQPKYVGDADLPKFLSLYERHYNTLVRCICCCCCCSCDSTMPLPDVSNNLEDNNVNRPIESYYESFANNDDEEKNA